MSRPFFVLVLLLLSISAFGQRATDRFIKDFIQEHRRGEENFAIKVPGWLIGMTGGIGALASSDGDERAAFRLLSEVGTTRVLTFDKEDYPNPGQTVGNFLYGLEQCHGYERWTEVRSRSGEQVNLSVRYAGKTIINLAVVIEEADRVVLVVAQSDISAKELGRLVREIEAG